MSENGANMKVKDIMSTELFLVSPDKKMNRIQDVIEWNNVRHVPVVDNEGYLLGIISQRDLLKTTISNADSKTQYEMLQKVPVSDFMKTDVITTTPDTDLSEAAWLLIENKIGCLPVLDKDRKMIGIVTESDFVKLAAYKH